MSIVKDKQHRNKFSTVQQGEWASLSLSKLEERLDADLKGLGTTEAQQRKDQYGYNELPERHVNPVLRLLSAFWGPIPWMIEAAAILSLAVRHWADFSIILILLFVNAIVGFWEEFQASNTIAALKAQLALSARVLRDGVWATVPARELVPGDVVHLRIGDVVPADARLLKGDPLEIDQSALTGESLPVTRRSEESVYSGSIVKRGEIDALVYATGQQTFFGATAHLVEKAHTTSHFQRAVLKIGNYLVVIALVLVTLILLVAYFRGDDMLTTLQFALILTVAAIPVAMPTVLSVTMAVGARTLAHKQAVVSRLASIEELAGIDVLCTDKTGTLTQNKLALGTPYCLDKSTPNDLILAAALASRREDQDPIDMAILSSLDATQEAGIRGYAVTHFQPFDPVQKRTEATVRDANGQQYCVTKGAPQVVQEMAVNAEATREQVDETIASFARRGFRALGIARTDQQNRWHLLGILPLFDPPRTDSKSTLETAKQMGVRIKMVTGDQVAIASEIAGQLGMGTHILDATQLSTLPGQKAEQRAQLIEQADGFAQVFPEHKYAIVESLQQQGHIVGMTGDGVNDAPALKKADAGIAVSGANDAAREAAAIVLLTPGLSVIIDAIKEGRKTFQHMSSYATYRIAESIRVLLFMTLSILIFNFYPVTAIMIVLLALLNDGAILSIAYDHVNPSNQPERWDMRSTLSIASILGVFGVIASFTLFYLAERVFHLDQAMVRSLMYLKLSVAGQLTIFITRSRGPFWSLKPAPLLMGATLTAQLIATLIAVYGVLITPIGWGWALAVWGYALFWFLINDRVKLLSYSFLNRHRSGPTSVDDKTAPTSIVHEPLAS